MFRKTRKNLIIAIILVILLIVSFGIYWIKFLNKAHSTFENYYNFRGCVQLLNRQEDLGSCQTKSGQTIKIVKFNGKWYLDGDLPVCWMGFCF